MKLSKKIEHPEWALKHKKKGTELRHIKGKYYLYRISSKWDKEKKRTRKITHEMIGRITEEDGLIPRGAKRTRKSTKPPVLKEVAIKESGASTVLQEKGRDIIESLQKHFPTRWRELFALSVQRLLSQSPLKNMDFLYQESMLSEEMKGLDLTKNKLTELLQEVGGQRESATAFMREFVDKGEQLVFDATHVISQSKNIQAAAQGYNSQGDFDPQVNLFYVFSVDKQSPVFYRIFPGNIQGMSALKLSIKEAGINKGIAIGDKGFFSEENLKTLAESNVQYIVPLKRDSKHIDYDRLHSGIYDDAFDGHFFYQGRLICYYTLPEKDGRKVVVFVDKKLKTVEETAYLKRVEDKKEGYTMSNYHKKQTVFGTISMITNMTDATPQEIYENYKSRMEVETAFDAYKNLLQADRTYMQSDTSLQGWMFINHIALMLYYKIMTLLKSHDMLSQISPRDLLLFLSKVKKVKIDGQWILSEINSKSKKLFDQLSLNVT